jgi:hypothetical protein
VPPPSGILPSGVLFVSAAPGQGTYDPSTGIWTVGTVAVDEPLMLVIQAVVVSPVAQTNVATITHSDQFDPNPNNNSASVTVTPQTPAPTVTNLQRFGFHAQPTEFVLTFSTALEPAPAEDVANYRLNVVVGHRIGRAIPIKAAIYNPTTHTVTLQPAHLVYLFAHYRLVVNGSTPTGVAGATGLLLDGRGNGVPGSDFVATFGKEILAGPNDPPRTSRRSLHVRHLPTTTHASSHQPTGSTAASRNQALSAAAVDAVLAAVMRPKKHE